MCFLGGNMDKSMIQQIKQAIENDSLIIFVGAGVSKNSGFPLWDEVLKEFKNDLELTENDDQAPLKIPQYYYDTFGQNSYFEKIEEIFKPYVNNEPNEIHNYISKIKPKHIITTNYDELLEKRFDKSDMQYEVIKSDMDIPYSKANNCLIKMHGDLKQRNIVLKESDYLSYENDFYMVSSLIKSLIMNNTILFLGYSLNDSTFNSIFNLIQKSFGNNAKRAYFYSPDMQSDTQKKYYEAKGIHILSNAVSNDENKGELTVKFLKELDSNWDKVPTNEVELWNKIKFLNHLNFVDSRTIARYSKLNTYARLESEYEFNWINKIETIDISKNANLVEFITNKTSLKQYLGFEIEEDKTTYQTNNRLNEAFDLYKDKQYANAKSKFRELANEAFVQKDYWTYLIAEFNIEHIGQSFLEEPVSIPDPIVTGVTFSKVIESLLLRGDNETKQLVKYFQDEIYSFEFIYQNLFRINNLLNKIKSEHSTYKRGGYSQNNYLHEIRALMNNLITFIESNKITISDYSEYKQIVASYTEALLIALNMSKIVPKKNKLFPNVTSTILETLTWNDIEIILDSWDAKNIDLIMEDCDFNEIQVDEEVFNKLIFVICNGIKEGTVQNNEFKRQQYLKLISMLKQVRIYDVDAVVSILNDLDLNVRNINAIKNLLAIIVTNVERVDNREKLFAIINDEINATLSDEVVRNAVINQFAQYKFILKK